MECSQWMFLCAVVQFVWVLHSLSVVFIMQMCFGGWCFVVCVYVFVCACVPACVPACVRVCVYMASVGIMINRSTIDFL